MAQSLYSPSWYRVARLRIRLRSHVQIHRQVFRGQVWFVLQDHASGRFHRFSPAAHLIISLMDGKRTVEEIWDIACARLNDEVPSQDEVIRLLAQLHQSDVLHGDVMPDVAAVTTRASRQKRRRLVLSFVNPLALRLRLFDPERFIDATYPLVRPFMGWAGALVIAGLIAAGFALAWINWPVLTDNITDRVLAAQSLVLLLVTYPLVKALHELGHAYAVKRWGGEVHEMGLMFLVFVPVPYVDASAAAAFRDKSRRAIVGAAGIIVELLLSALALIVWLNLEPGLLRAFAFNVMLIGGVSTLFFNGNPLLRFDGYYVFSDLIEIPNLYQRANRFIVYLIQRHLFGLREAPNPVNGRGEARWFVVYGVASFVYRLFITVAIVGFVATKFFFLGILMAIWSVTIMYLVPLAKGVRFIMTSPSLRRRRRRAVGVTVGVLACLGAVLAFLPLPYATVTQGVIWMPGDSVVHAGTDGVVAKVLAQPNSRVTRGQPVIELADPFIGTQVKVLEAEAAELKQRLVRASLEDRAEAKIVFERLRHTEAELNLNRQRAADLVVRSPASGTFVLPHAQDLEGKFLHKGALIGYVRDRSDPIVRVVVSQDDIELVRERTKNVMLRLVSRFHDRLRGEIVREIPTVSNQLPSLVLATVGGGRWALNPASRSRPEPLERVFQLELRMAKLKDPPNIGERVYVRFDHGSEPIANRVYRHVRQKFLKVFGV